MPLEMHPISDLKNPMSDSLNGEEEFILVTYKRKKKKLRKQDLILSSVMQQTPDIFINLANIMRDIQYELNCSDFMVQFKENLHPVLNEWNLGHLITSQDSNDSLNCGNSLVTKDNENQHIEIVCYGLGQFSSCVISRYQLAFLLILKQIIHPVQVHIYDPLFCKREIVFLKDLGLNVLDINEKGKRTVTTNSICFLPHCDLPLYNNLLWANWNMNSLSKLVIIGNSFQSYTLNLAKGCLKERAKYVYLTNKFFTEIRIPNIFRFNDIFNDLSIHYFKSSSLSKVDSYFWTDVEEPKYSDADEIIILNYNDLKL